MKLFKQNRRQERVSYRDGSSGPCDSACRADRQAEQHRVWALAYGTFPGPR